MKTCNPGEKFYMTTAIAYTSRKPHIGNVYEIVLSDAIARFKRMQGYDVFFLTGTDEHGQKIENYAAQQGLSPKEYVDGVSAQVREAWDLMNSSYDHFIRTTDDYHVTTVQKIFQRFYEQGDIYKGHYEGHYCVPCESFFTESQLVEGKCPDCGGEVHQAQEEAYFFKMSKYQDRLLKHIEENPDFICPESRKKEMVNNFLKPGLQDLCVSRSSFKWGIPVPFDEKHVIYVWVDALSNYITALGYLQEDPAKFEKYWPANVHIIGKDILRFHTIYWPIFLMALDLPLPKQIFGHPWLLSGQDKMSKSKGNVIYADDLVNLFGLDAVRFYLLSQMPYAQDGSITFENVIAEYNTNLANTIGNLVNRTVSMVQKYFDGVIPACGELTEEDRSLREAAAKACEDFCASMDGYHTADAADALVDLARRSNKYIDETAPWVLARDEAGKKRLETVLYHLLESIRYLGVLAGPLMPETSAEILRQINATEISLESLATFGKTVTGDSVADPKPLFARIDEKKKMEEIAALYQVEEAPAEKKEVPAKKEAPAKAEKAAEKKLPEGIITIDEFAKVELRVAQVLTCEPVPKAEKLLKLTLDDGAAGRQVVSGIAKWYAPEDLIGKKIIVVANLAPAKLRGVESQGMILAADVGEDAKVIFVDDAIPVGAKIR